MGSKHSSSGKKQINEIKITKGILDKKSEKKTDMFSYLQYNNTSSYAGIKSEVSSDIMMKETKESYKSLTNSEEIIEKKSKDDYVDKKLKTVFYWRDGGNTVYITGNFSNWNQWFLMNKEKNGLFSLVLDLPKGIYQFKFIVDNVWKCSRDYKTINDGKNNMNNEIDNAFFAEEEVNAKKHEQTEKKISDNRTIIHKYTDGKIENTKTSEATLSKIFDKIDIDTKINYNKPNINLANKELNKTVIGEKNCLEAKIGIIKQSDKEELLRTPSYAEIVPSKCELNCDAPLIPYQYQKIFDIKKISNQENIGNLDNFCYSFSIMGLEENSSYMRIFPPPHILLNHLLSNCSNRKFSHVLKVSSTSRAKNKFVTFIYYKPVKRKTN